MLMSPGIAAAIADLFMVAGGICLMLMSRNIIFRRRMPPAGQPDLIRPILFWGGLFIALSSAAMAVVDILKQAPH